MGRGGAMLIIYRIAHLLARARIPLLPRLLYMFNRIVFSIVLPPTSIVGRDVLFGYSGLGIVVHARCKIGDRVNIGPHVTLGGRAGLNGVPEIGDDVLIGSGAKILGPVRIGNGARIGANAVVLQDVPAGATAVGIPARIRGGQAGRAPSTNGLDSSTQVDNEVSDLN